MLFKFLFILPFLTVGSFVVYKQTRQVISADFKQKKENKKEIQSINLANINNAVIPLASINKKPSTANPTPLVVSKDLNTQQTLLQEKLSENENNLKTIIKQYNDFLTKEKQSMESKKTKIEQKWTNEKTRLENLKKELSENESKLKEQIKTLNASIKSIVDTVNAEVLTKFT